MTVLTNRMIDPSSESSISGAQASAGVALYTASFDTAFKHTATRSLKLTRTTSTPSNNIGVSNMSPAAAANAAATFVTPGEVISAACFLASDQANFRAKVQFAFRDSGNAAVGTVIAGPTLSGLAANTWVRVVVEGVTVPATADHVLVQGGTFMPVGVNTVGGELSWYDSVMLNTGLFALPYFDGNTTSDSVFTYAWTGTANQSTSTRTELDRVGWGLIPMML